MARVYVHNEEGRITGYVPSAHTPDYLRRNDVLINPEAPNNVPLKYLIVDQGTLREMTTEEKAQVDQGEANEAAAREAAAGNLDNERLLKAMVLEFVDEFNRNREWHGKSAITYAAARDSIVERYKALG